MLVQTASSSNPPTNAALHQHILHDKYQVRKWHLAHIAKCLLALTTEHRWANDWIGVIYLLSLSFENIFETAGVHCSPGG